MKEIRLWIWRNGPGKFVAYDEEYPCHENGDPKTLGEPIGVAIFQPYEKSSASMSAHKLLLSEC